MTHAVLYSHPLEGQYQVLIGVIKCSSFSTLFTHVLPLACDPGPPVMWSKCSHPLSSEDVVICVWMVLMEPVILADVHYQHISPRRWLWVISQGEVIRGALTGGWFVSPHRRFVQACVQVSRLQQAEMDSSQHSQPDSARCPTASASGQAEDRKRLHSAGVNVDEMRLDLGLSSCFGNILH